MKQSRGSRFPAFRATPGEKIDINTPSQANAMERMERMMREGGGGGGRVVNVGDIHVHQSGRSTNYTSEQQGRKVKQQILDTEEV